MVLQCERNEKREQQQQRQKVIEIEKYIANVYGWCCDCVVKRITRHFSLRERERKKKQHQNIYIDRKT